MGDAGERDGPPGVKARPALFLLRVADVDLEVQVALGQHLCIGDDPLLAFEGDVVANLQDLADVVRRHVRAVLEADAVAVAGDQGRSSTPRADPRVFLPTARWGPPEPRAWLR
jgi:hypothetical protein